MKSQRCRSSQLRCSVVLSRRGKLLCRLTVAASPLQRRDIQPGRVQRRKHLVRVRVRVRVRVGVRVRVRVRVRVGVGVRARVRVGARVRDRVRVGVRVRVRVRA